MPDVVLPVLDEAAAIRGVLASIPSGWNAIVVDNGSTDDSAAIANALGAHVVHRGSTRLRLGVLRRAARGHFGSGRVHGLRWFPRRRRPGPRRAACLRSSRDLVLGARTADPGAWPWHLRVANRYLAGAVRRRTGVRLRDLGPMRAARRAELLVLDLRDRRFGWPLEMVLRAGAAGWAIEEVDVAYHPRVGRSKVTGTVGGVVRTVHDMRLALR